MDTVAADAGTNILDAIHHAVGSDVGLRREENQDSYGVVERQSFKVFMVADGMGGAQGGATASQLAVFSIQENLGEKNEITAEAFVEAVYASNHAIYQKASEDSELLGMGTTFVGLLFIDTSLHVIHVGDSRAYRIREGKTCLLTEDHTLVKELVKSGAISEAQAENHPISHMLTRSLGPSEDTLVDCTLSLDGPVRGDMYLLCSDGLYNLVQDQEFADLIQGVSMEEAIQRLIALANERGGTDNITVLLVEIGEDYPVTLADIMVYGKQEELDESEAGTAGTADREVADEARPQLRLMPSSPPETSVTNEERARRIDLLLEETAAILERQKREEKDQKVRKILFFVVLCIFGIGVFLFKHTFDQFAKHKRSNLPAPAADSVAVRPVEPKKEKPAGVPSAYRSQYAVGSRLVDLRLEVPAITTLWPDKGGEDSEAAEASSKPKWVEAGALLEAEKRHIRDRKDVLRQQIVGVDAKLERFDQPITVEFGSYLKESGAKTEMLTKTSAEIRQELDTATRKLSVWFDRKKRLEVGDPINMASEVAVSSDAVRAKKEIFEKVTWDYLKELETLRFSQHDAEQEKKVEELLDHRTVAVKELTIEVKKAIDENISAADQKISELMQRRDGIEAEIAQISREVDFIRSIMNSNPGERERLKAEILHERANLQAELDELRKILPDELDAQQPSATTPAH